MLSAKLTNQERRAVYERDGFRCALCDSTRYLQIHHHVPRGQGGTNSPHNLITLCSDCHALAHGTNLRDWQDVTQEDIQQALTEYLAERERRRRYARVHNSRDGQRRTLVGAHMPLEQAERVTWLATIEGMSTTAYVKHALELAGRQTLKEPKDAEQDWQDDGPYAVTASRP